VRVARSQDETCRVRLLLLDEDGAEVAPDCRFLAHLADADYSTHTAASYAYDLRLVFEFCPAQPRTWTGVSSARRRR